MSAFTPHHQLVYHPIVFSDTHVYDMPQRLNPTSNFDSTSNMMVRDEEGFPSFLLLRTSGGTSFPEEDVGYLEGEADKDQEGFQGRGLEGNSSKPNPCVQC